MKEDEEQTLDDILNGIDIDKEIDDEPLRYRFSGTKVGNKKTYKVSLILLNDLEKSYCVLKKTKKVNVRLFIPKSVVVDSYTYANRIVMILPEWYVNKQMPFVKKYSY